MATLVAEMPAFLIAFNLRPRLEASENLAFCTVVERLTEKETSAPKYRAERAMPPLLMRPATLRLQEAAMLRVHLLRKIALSLQCVVRMTNLPCFSETVIKILLTPPTTKAIADDSSLAMVPCSPTIMSWNTEDYIIVSQSDGVERRNGC